MSISTFYYVIFLFCLFATKVIILPQIIKQKSTIKKTFNILRICAVFLQSYNLPIPLVKYFKRKINVFNNF